MEQEDVLLDYYRWCVEDSWYQEDGCERDAVVK